MAGRILMALHSYKSALSLSGIPYYSGWKCANIGRSKAIKEFTEICSQQKTTKKRKRQKNVKQTLNQKEKEAEFFNSPSNVDSDKRDDKAGTEFLSENQQRDDVLNACVITSGAFSIATLVIRQVSHIAAEEGLPFPDVLQTMPYSLGWYEAESFAALVLVVSSCRQVLLKTWPAFSESSQAANEKVLQPLRNMWDYLIISVFSGISEELFFRGVLLPFIGCNLVGIMVSGIIFGALHYSTGRKSSFVFWASFVGIAYGFAAVSSSSLLVPMAAHSVNNLIGGLLWKYFDSSKKASENI